jgi:hypothetical protein
MCLIRARELSIWSSQQSWRIKKNAQKTFKYGKEKKRCWHKYIKCNGNTVKEKTYIYMNQIKISYINKGANYLIKYVLGFCALYTREAIR